MLLNPMLLTLRSRFTPLPATSHLLFCAFATVVFLLIFLRKKTVSSLIWLLICDTTAVLQFYNDKSTASAVAICEVFLFIILIWIRTHEKIAEKQRLEREKKEKELAEGAYPDNLGDIDKLIKAETTNIADNSDDVIKNAFEDDHP